jgi:endonuclease-3
MKKREKLEHILKILEDKYGEPKVMLKYSTPFELLIAVILSAQCTDKRVNIVTEKMFKEVNTPEAFAEMSLEKIEEHIKSTGFYRNKAKNIKACSKAIVEKHNGQVPMDIASLIELAGVGRKTANVVMGDINGKPEGIVVDTHVKRLSNRIGFVDSDNPIIIERELMKWIPKKYWFLYPNMLINHGRAICNARKPKCEKCEIKKFCNFFKKALKIK